MIHKLYNEIVEAEVPFGRRLWNIDSWLSYKGVEGKAAIDPSYSGPGELFGSRQCYNSGRVWRVRPTPRAKPDTIPLHVNPLLITGEHALTS